mmetsp:Transcript_76407/g.247344  ORF Transcript_76407/g.247344 Transcript_76407/m.247344 type:complete len:789 (-) Transcript_76407:563-2929(-)
MPRRLQPGIRTASVRHKSSQASGHRSLGPAARLVQSELRVPIRGRLAIQHEPQRCLERNAAIRVGGHGAVGFVAGVLLVDNLGHLLEGIPDFLLGDEAMVQPIRQQLRGDPQGRPVLHEADVREVGHLRAADAEVNPPHDIPEDALRALAELLIDGLRVERRLEQRRLQKLFHLCGRTHGELHLPRGHIHAVVVEAVKGGRSGRWHPSSAGSCHRFRDLRLQHGLHGVGFSPHALSDLCLALEAGMQADVDVRVLVRLDPRLLLHVCLTHHGACEHARVDLVARAIQKTSVDKEHPLGGSPDALPEVRTGPALLVHDAHLDGIPAEAEEFLRAAEDRGSQGDLPRPVHLRLDDVHRAHPTVHDAAGAAEVLQSGGGGHQAIHESFGHHSPIGCHDHVGKHVVADVAHKGHGTTRQRLRVALLVPKPNVLVRAADEGLAVLDERRLQSAAHDTANVAVDAGLVLGVNRGDRVLHVEDCGQGCLDSDILDATQCSPADRIVAIDLEHHVQAVVFQEDSARVRERRQLRRSCCHGAGRIRRPKTAHRTHKQGRNPEAGGVSALKLKLKLLALAHELWPEPGDLGPLAEGQRGDLIEEAIGELDDCLTTKWVVATRRRRCRTRRIRTLQDEAHTTGTELHGGGGDDVEAVQRIEEGTPTGIDCVEHIAGVVRGHHELGRWHGGDLDVHELGGHAHGAAVLLEVADLPKEGLALLPHLGRRGVAARGAATLVEAIDLGLQLVAPHEASLELGPELSRQAREARPEVGGAEAGAGADRLLHHLQQSRVDLQPTD